LARVGTLARDLLYLSLVKNIRQLVSAGAGGAIGTAADVGMLALLVEHGVRIPVAAFFGAAMGAVVNFVINKYLAFRDRTPITGSQLGRFGLVAVATAVLMAILMELVAVKLGVPYLIAKLICAVAVFAVWTYPAQRRLVFQQPRRHAHA
jgi:putative flippase GtrA